MSRVGETGVGEMGIGKTGVGEMGVGETGPNHMIHIIFDKENIRFGYA